MELDQSPNPPGWPEARRHPRMPYRRIVVIRRSGASRNISGLAHDLSAGGVAVSTQEELPIGAKVLAWISSVVDVDVLLCEAIVRYRRDLRHGLEFQDLTTEQAELLARTCRIPQT